MDRLELAIQRNQFLHWFVYDGMFNVALYKILRKQEGGLEDTKGKEVTRNELAEDTKFLCILLKHEFIFKPTEARSAEAYDLVLNRVTNKLIDAEIVAEVGQPSPVHVEDENPTDFMPVRVSETYDQVQKVAVLQESIPRIFSWPDAVENMQDFQPELISFYASLFFPFIDGHF